SEDTERLLGFGRKTTPQLIAESAVTALMRHFPSPGEETSLVHGKRKPLFRGGPLAFRTRDLDPATPHLICILPFENDSPVPEASRVVADLLSLRLAAANGFEVVEPATLRAAALKAGIASFRGTASDDLARLAPALGTSLFLRGTIYRYGTEAVQIEVSLVDINSGRILWSAQHDRKGSDYIGFLMLGAPSNAVSLTDRVVAEMIDTAWHGPASGHPVASTKAKSPEQHSRLRGTQTNGENR
ncbi:MAG TPA: hypothetical protein VNN08_07470, partial [Thermoanaerobaculia bacterium]|nr:hypothetical protein [Thermoanaerobaculia bacterium]